MMGTSIILNVFVKAYSQVSSLALASPCDVTEAEVFYYFMVLVAFTCPVLSHCFSHSGRV